MCAASLELLVVFSVRDVGFKKMPFLGAGSVFAFSYVYIYILFVMCIYILFVILLRSTVY